MQAPLAEIFADFVYRTRFSDVTPSAAERACQSTLDTVGVMMAATALEPSVVPLLDLVLDAGGRPECTVLGTQRKVSAIMAAFANGGFAHALDFDDHAPEGHHPSSSIVPVCLALSERLGNITGAQFVTAVALGQDMFMRIRRNVVWKHDWHLTTIIGVFSATASAAYLLGLDRSQTANALGIAGVQAAGTYELVQGVENEVRGMYAGFVSKHAIISALLAQRNVRGPHTIFDGPTGFFNVYFQGRYDRERMLERLGEMFLGEDLCYKPWPTCGLSHTYIHACRRLLAENAIAFDEIARIRIFAGEGPLFLCTPLEMRCNPQTSSDAKFSIPYIVALTLRNGTVAPADFTPEGLRNEHIREIASRIVVEPETDVRWESSLPDGRVELTMKSGRVFSCTGSNVPGHPGAPMGWDELIEKYESCLRASSVCLSDAAIADTVRMLRNIDSVGNVARIVDLLAGRGGTLPHSTGCDEPSEQLTMREKRLTGQAAAGRREST